MDRSNEISWRGIVYLPSRPTASRSCNTCKDPPRRTSTHRPRASPMLMASPQRVPLAFRQANVSAMQAKLHQIDQSLRNEIVRILPSPVVRAHALFAVVDFIISDVSPGAHAHRRSLRVPRLTHLGACALETPATQREPAHWTTSGRHHLIAGEMAKGGVVPWFVPGLLCVTPADGLRSLQSWTSVASCSPSVRASVKIHL